MGADVVMKARLRVPMSDEEVSALDVAFREEFGVEVESDGAIYPRLERDRYDLDVIALVTLQRFYGPGYERGRWPRIKEQGDWLAVRLGEHAELRYGSDAGDTEWDALIPWEETRAGNDRWWNEHGNEPYRARVPIILWDGRVWGPNEPGRAS